MLWRTLIRFKPLGGLHRASETWQPEPQSSFAGSVSIRYYFEASIIEHAMMNVYGLTELSSSSQSLVFLAWLAQCKDTWEVFELWRETTGGFTTFCKKLRMKECISSCFSQCAIRESRTESYWLLLKSLFRTGTFWCILSHQSGVIVGLVNLKKNQFTLTRDCSRQLMKVDFLPGRTWKRLAMP